LDLEELHDDGSGILSWKLCHQFTEVSLIIDKISWKVPVFKFLSDSLILSCTSITIYSKEFIVKQGIWDQCSSFVVDKFM
jgi:hypothetical protein